MNTPIRILIIDDDEMDRDTIQKALQASDLNVDISEATNAESGIKAFKAGIFDCVLLDYSLPDRDGLEVLAELRSDSHNTTPVISLTGIGDKMSAILIQAGATDYLNKNDLNPHRLQRSIRYSLARSQHLDQVAEEHQREMQKLKRALAIQETMRGWQQGAVTADLAGVGPIRTRAPEQYEAMQSQYETLLDSYLEALGFGKRPSRDEINQIAQAVGALGGGPRDVIDIHLNAVRAKSQNVHPKRAQTYAVEGRLLVVELMGFLVDFYREHQFTKRESDTHREYKMIGNSK